MQTDNKGNFLSLDFGLREFGIADKSETLRPYRKYVYEAGAVAQADNPGAKTINQKIIVSVHRVPRLLRWRALEVH